MLKKLTLAALVLTSLNAQASSFGVAECYNLPHGVNGQGSTNTILIPGFDVEGSNSLRVHLTSIDSKPVNIRVALFDETGQPYAPSDFTLGGIFNSSSNTPLGGLNGRTALLKPMEVGVFDIKESHHSGPLTAQVSWQVDSCDRISPLDSVIPPKVVVSVKQMNIDGFNNINIVTSRNGNQF